MTTNLKNKAYQIIKERIMSCDYKPNTFVTCSHHLASA